MTRLGRDGQGLNVAGEKESAQRVLRVGCRALVVALPFMLSTWYRTLSWASGRSSAATYNVDADTASKTVRVQVPDQPDAARLISANTSSGDVTIRDR